MALKSIMLSEKKNLPQKVMYNLSPFTQHSRNNKTIEMEKRLVVAHIRGWEEWDGVNSMRNFFCGDRTVLYLDFGAGYRNLYLG